MAIFGTYSGVFLAKHIQVLNLLGLIDIPRTQELQIVQDELGSDFLAFFGNPIKAEIYQESGGRLL